MTHTVKTSSTMTVEWSGDEGESDTVTLFLSGGATVTLTRVDAEKLGRYLLFRTPEVDA